MADEPRMRSMPTVDIDEDLGFVDAPMPVEVKRPEPVRAAVPIAVAPPSQDSLLSQQTETSVSAAFGSLAHAMFTQEPRTIEDVMKELLRPMVKTWLDDNLPGVVERLVQEEIARVARGRR